MAAFKYESFLDRWIKAIRDKEKPIAAAATAAITEASNSVKKDVRADIAAAGFSVRWQNAFRAVQYPKSSKPSMRPAVHFFHKIPYADVFESGANIRGKPKLWLPLPSVPRGARGNRPLTPKQYIERIGPLTPGRSKAGRSLLFGRAGRKSILRAGESSTRVRKGAFGRGVFGESVPLYVGLDSVSIRKKFHIRQIVRQVGSRIGVLYARHLKT